MAVVKGPVKKKKAAGGKSGMRTLKPGELLFNDGEKANSLYIIQKGQLRLFKPKGKGFVEIAVLRNGEVIGEMAYFDDDSGGKRSCSAAAMVSTDIIEISFTAFAKTMSGLNPWFKTIIHTLAKRLRATNARVKELESNSASVNYGTGKHTGYEFFKTADIIKILGTFFLVFKSHGETNSGGLAVHRKTMELYSHEIFGVIESKMDEMIFALEDIGLLEIQDDKDGLPKVMVLKDLNQMRSFFIFYNTEKHLTEDKKLSISIKCQTFLEEIWKKIATNPNTESVMTLVEVQSLLNHWKNKGVSIGIDSLDDAREHGLVGEVIIGDGNALSIEVHHAKLSKMLPNIKFLNRMLASNKSKSAMG